MLKFAAIIALSAGTLCLVDNCQECSSSSPYICLGCETSFSLTSSGCLYSEGYINEFPPNCILFRENKSCLKCAEEYHELNGFCQADCYDDCLCFKPYDCISEDMKNDKIAYTDTDDKKCIEGCLKCNNTETCTECKKGYYKNNTDKCSKCDSLCETCSSSEYCDTCKYNDAKFKKCPKKSSKNSMIVIPIILSISLLVLTALIVLAIRGCCRKKRSENDQVIQEGQNDNGLSNLHKDNQIPICNQEIEEAKPENSPKICRYDSITEGGNGSHLSFSSECKAKFEDSASKNGPNCEINFNEEHIAIENKEDEIKSLIFSTEDDQD